MAKTLILTATKTMLHWIFLPLKKNSMKHNPLIFTLIIASLIALTSCGGSKANDPQPGVPTWASGYPLVPAGAQTADIVLQADKKSTAYYVIAEKALALTPEQLKDQVTGTTDPSVKFKDKVVIEANVAQTVTVSGLTQHKKYYAYVVSESVADATLQSDVKSFDFTTYYRQDTSRFKTTAEGGTQALFLIYRPEKVLKYPDQKYPICFFMGGNGEVAAPGQINVIRNGTLAEYIYKGNDVDMIVMSLQQTKADWSTKLIDDGVEYGFATYPVDLKKVYMVGISGGGFGCWNYAVDYASKLTAIVPISGGGSTGKACNLNALPIWAFCNQPDPIVAYTNSVNMVNAVKACVARPASTEIKFNIFPDNAHDCWRRVFDQHHSDWSLPGKNDAPKVDIYAWLLSKSK